MDDYTRAMQSSKHEYRADFSYDDMELVMEAKAQVIKNEASPFPA